MNGITSRLQVFLAKIAGKDVDVSTLTPPVAINEEEKLMLDIADRIDAIESGGGLPTVTADDNGDVLTVVEGAWDKATPSGGGNIFDVEYEVYYDDNDDLVVTCNHTVAEILSAHTEGQVITMKAMFYQTLPFYNAIGVNINIFDGTPNIMSHYSYCWISGSQPTSNDVFVFSDIVWDSGYQKWVCNSFEYALTPAT